MQYYRVHNILDGCQVYSRKTQKYIHFLGGELYTLRELERMGVAWVAKKLEAVEVSRRKIYWFFGARFATEGAGTNENNK